MIALAKIFIAAFGLGMIFNAAPGAVFAETVRRGIRGGFRAALGVQLGSLAGDALWAVLGLAGVGLLLRLDVVRVPVGVAGALYLAWLARDAWKAADRELVEAAATEASDARPSHSRSSLRSGVLLSIGNPQNVGYWAALGSALGSLGAGRPTAVDYGVYFAGFMTASVVWAFACAALVDRLFRRAGATWVRLTYRVCALVFLALALSTLRDLWRASYGDVRDPSKPPASLR